MSSQIAARVASLQQYAKRKVDESRAEIIDNLTKSLGPLPQTLDIALPGAAYFSVAAGGLADVAHIAAMHGEDS